MQKYFSVFMLLVMSTIVPSDQNYEAPREPRGQSLESLSQVAKLMDSEDAEKLYSIADDVKDNEAGQLVQELVNMINDSK